MVHSNTGKLSTVDCSYWVTSFLQLHNPQWISFLQLWCIIFRNGHQCLWDMQWKFLNNSFAQFWNYCPVYNFTHNIRKINYMTVICKKNNLKYTLRCGFYSRTCMNTSNTTQYGWAYYMLLCLFAQSIQLLEWSERPRFNSWQYRDFPLWHHVQTDFETQPVPHQTGIGYFPRR
jgi:hypothetical protein